MGNIRPACRQAGFGSDGCRFEPCRGHKEEAVSILRRFFLCLTFVSFKGFYYL